jgi:hypothetical protein
MEVEGMASPPKIPLTIGTVSGPVFGVFDLTGLDSKYICNFELLELIPTGLIGLSQILMIMHPEQIKNHQCSDEKCLLSQTTLAKIPKVDYICRAFFPSEELYYRQWKEASISIGGSMLATRYLNKLKAGKDKSWFFAFWNHETRTWESLEVACERNGLYCATLHRKDFRPPNSIYQLARKSMLTEELEEKATELLKILQAAIEKPNHSKIPSFALTVFVENPGSVQVPNSLNVNINFVPFLPIFVGEIQNVVPVGDFLRNFILQKNRGAIISAKPYSNLIKDLRHIFHHGDIRKHILKYFVILDSWKQEELLKDYPLKDSGCGWTFFKDCDPGDHFQSSFPHEYLTLEPGAPVIPPFGNSASGALACAVAHNLLYDEESNIAKKYRGKTNSEDKPWGERFYGSSAASDGKYLSIWKGQNDLWTIRAHTRIFGQYKDYSQL